MPKPSTPADRYELLAQVGELAEEARLGHRAFTERVHELADGGFSAGGTAGPSAPGGRPPAGFMFGEGKAPTRRIDPAQTVWRDFDHALHRVHRELSRLIRIHREHVMPTHGSSTLSDPGCHLCAELSKPNRPVHSPTYRHVCARHKLGQCDECDRRKAARLPVCFWCSRFVWKNGRIPTRDERLAHHEGRRVRVGA